MSKNPLLLGLLGLLAYITLALAQGYINPPIFATGYIIAQPGTTVTTRIPNTRNPPSNLNVFAGGNITIWNVTLPSPAFDGQIITVACPLGTVSTLTVSAISPDTLQPGPTSCSGAQNVQYQYISNTSTVPIWVLLASVLTTTNPTYTVAGLPGTATTGQRAYVLDALSCTPFATLVGGGPTSCPVSYNGTVWIAD